MSEAKRSEEPEQERDGAHGPAADGADADGQRGRRRSKTMSRKEIARELRRQRAFGLVDPELDAVMQEMEAMRPRSRADCANG
ncbi:MAG TPA: DNA-binding protein, partial [Anaeromyxobacter sp.]|nr:DNA-binding protein [Anaeromyxobacter sp.]